ncbi:MAG TPA: serine/threonine-protein kinase [Acidobacteriaceae bacterium]|nr:serine/threonine-protein kinase [Acidobacteriaceae bacterium]
MTFQPGQVIGEYEIVRVLGKGGLGAVYEAVHQISRRAEAMKVMLPEQTGTADMKERFRREIQLLASLNHPNIAGLHNAFYFEDQLIMVMELVEGEDLRTRSRRGSLAMPTLMDYATQVLGALDYAHARGVVHRDIKPANIMVSFAGLIKVLDFGIAIAPGAVDLTLAGSVIGSPLHMSPEQIRGEKATQQSDIYSFGVTMYELIAGRPPLNGATTYDIMMAQVNSRPVPLAELRPDISRSLSDAISRALEKEPAKRFSNAAEFLGALRSQSVADNSAATAISPSSSPQRTTTTGGVKPPTTESFSPPVQQLVRHLASFIGPIAKVIVGRLANQFTDLDRLYAESAKQIEDEADRKRFLRTRPPPV